MTRCKLESGVTVTRREACLSTAATIAGLLAATAQNSVAEIGSTLAIKADILYTVSGAPIKNGMVLIRSGKIVSVGSGIQIPAGVRTIHTAVAMPGLVDSHSYLGCYYEGTEPVDAVTPDFRIIDGFDCTDPNISKTVKAGVTTVAIMPGNSNVLGGQAAILRLGSAADIISRSAGQKISATTDAASAERNPTSRAGALSLLKSAFVGAKSGVAVSGVTQTTTLAGYPTDFSERVASLLPLLAGHSKAYFHAPSADDVDNALSIVDTFKLRAALVHSTEGYLAAAQIASHRVPVLLGPLGFTDSDRVLANAAKLSQAGVRVAFCTDAPLSDPNSMRLSAYLAVQFGLSRSNAIRALTLTPAEVLGVSDRVGSIEVGKEADIVLLSADPLDLTARIEGVIMRGRLQAHA